MSLSVPQIWVVQSLGRLLARPKCATNLRSRYFRNVTAALKFVQRGLAKGRRVTVRMSRHVRCGFFLGLGHDDGIGIGFPAVENAGTLQAAIPSAAGVRVF